MNQERTFLNKWKKLLRVRDTSNSEYAVRSNVFFESFLSSYKSYFLYDFRTFRFIYLSDFCKSQIGALDMDGTLLKSFPFHRYIHTDDFRVMSTEGLNRLFTEISEISPSSYESLGFEFTYRLVGDSGEIKHILQSMYFLEVDEDGGVITGLGSLSDINHHASRFYQGETFYSHSIFIKNKKNKFSHFSTFLPKPDDTNEDPLTFRQKQILKLLSQGFSSKMIGERLKISRHTVDTHRRKMLEKLNMNSSAQMVRYAMEKGFI